MSTKNRVWRQAALAVVLLASGCTSSTDEPAPSSSSPNPFASLEHQVQLFLDEGAVAAVVQIRWPMPTELEDPSTQDKRDYLNDRIESTLNETLDRICKPAN